MGLYNRGQSWWIDYYYPPGRGGTRHRERVGPVRDEARILLAKRLEDIRQGRDPALRRMAPTPFSEMAEEFLKRHAKRLRGYDKVALKIGMMKRAFSGRMLQEITPKAIEQYVADRMVGGAKPGTVNRDRAILSKLFNCAIAWDYYGGENPVRRVKRFEEPAGWLRFLTGDEAKRLTEGAPVHLRLSVLASLHTGGRVSELLGLRWEDADLARGVLYFDQRNTKSGKQREIPVSSELAAAIRAKARALSGPGREFIFTRHGKRMQSIRTAFEKARKGAGLGEDVTPHTLRHTFVSWFVQNGGDRYRLQRLLGHSTILLTQRYAHLGPDYLRASVGFIGAPKHLQEAANPAAVARA